MIKDTIYAQLASHVYNRTLPNRIPEPADWKELSWKEDNALTGFSAGVYKNGNEIVIAYTGTNENLVADTWHANLPATLGNYSEQVLQAMVLYLEVKRDNPKANISFTGHSLGGGLASIMAMYFDKEATVFDSAAFALSAKRLDTITKYQAAIRVLGFSDADLDRFTTIDPADYGRRQLKVQGISVDGEILQPSRHRIG